MHGRTGRCRRGCAPRAKPAKLEPNRSPAGERPILQPLHSIFVSPGRRVNSPPRCFRSRCVLGRFAAACLSLLAAGCVTPADRIAARAGLERVELIDLPLPLVAYRRPCTSIWNTTAGRGRGRAGLHWTRRRARRSCSNSPGAIPVVRSAWGRPCYGGFATHPACGPLLWTHRRYSAAVVGAMVADLRRLLPPKLPGSSGLRRRPGRRRWGGWVTAAPARSPCYSPRTSPRAEPCSPSPSTWTSAPGPRCHGAPLGRRRSPGL